MSCRSVHRNYHLSQSSPTAHRLSEHYVPSCCICRKYRPSMRTVYHHTASPISEGKKLRYMSCRSANRYCRPIKKSQTVNKSPVHSLAPGHRTRNVAGQRTLHQHAASPVPKGKKHWYMSSRSILRYFPFCKKISTTHRSQNLPCGLTKKYSPELTMTLLSQHSVITVIRNSKLASTHGSSKNQVRTVRNRMLEVVCKQNKYDSSARTVSLTTNVRESETGNAQQWRRDY